MGRHFAATKVAFSLLTSLSIAACAEAPLASLSRDREAKEFVSPPPDKVRLYIYRDQMEGSATRMEILLDGKWVGATGGSSYVMLVVEPGVHTIVSRAEDDAELTLHMSGGFIYYIWQEVVPGTLLAGSELHVVDSRTGKEGVRNCDLTQARPPRARRSPATVPARLVPQPPPAADY
jgi:hypothetical protein